MSGQDFWDFMLEGGNELFKSEAYPLYGEVTYLDRKIDQIYETNKIAKCPECDKVPMDFYTCRT